MVGPGFRGRVGVSFRVGFRVRVRFGVRQSKIQPKNSSNAGIFGVQG